MTRKPRSSIQEFVNETKELTSVTRELTGDVASTTEKVMGGDITKEEIDEINNRIADLAAKLDEYIQKNGCSAKLKRKSKRLIAAVFAD